jgi:hypothetical protein
MIAPENRAVAPVWSGPANTVLPHPGATPPRPTSTPTSTPNAQATMPDSTGLEGKSRTLQGPSAADWARHRETIVGLYRQYPLKRVSEIMRKHYGFSARYARLVARRHGRPLSS